MFWVIDDNRKISYVDAKNLYGRAMSQCLLLNEIEMWRGHPDSYMDKLKNILKTPDDSDIGYFFEVDWKI